VLAALAHDEALALEVQLGEQRPSGAGGLDEDLVDAGLRVA